MRCGRPPSPSPRRAAAVLVSCRIPFDPLKNTPCFGYTLITRADSALGIYHTGTGRIGPIPRSQRCADLASPLIGDGTGEISYHEPHGVQLSNMIHGSQSLGRAAGRTAYSRGGAAPQQVPVQLSAELTLITLSNAKTQSSAIVA